MTTFAVAADRTQLVFLVTDKGTSSVSKMTERQWLQGARHQQGCPDRSRRPRSDAKHTHDSRLSRATEIRNGSQSQPHDEHHRHSLHGRVRRDRVCFERIDSRGRSQQKLIPDVDVRVGHRKASLGAARSRIAARLHMGMKRVILAGMKTAVSIPDSVFHQVDRTAKRLGVSRSEVFSRAVRQYIEAAAEQDITASYDAAFGKEPEEADAKRWRRAVARKALLSVEWDDR